MFASDRTGSSCGRLRRATEDLESFGRQPEIEASGVSRGEADMGILGQRFG